MQPENSTSTALLPGPDYGTAVCQQQVQVLTQTLATVSVCSEWKSKILCECQSQEECLGRILNAALKFSSESCASERKACGEKIDFEPELSQSFAPDFRPFANFAGEKSGKMSPSLAEQKQCQLYHLCKKTPEPHGDVAGTARPNPSLVFPHGPLGGAGVVLPETWAPIDPAQRSPDGLSRKNVVPGLSVQTSEALSGASVGGVKETSMNDSKEKMLNTEKKGGFSELPPEANSVPENPTFWAWHPLETTEDLVRDSSKLQKSIFSPSATLSPNEISLFPFSDLTTSS